MFDKHPKPAAVDPGMYVVSNSLAQPTLDVYIVRAIAVRGVPEQGLSVTRATIPESRCWGSRQSPGGSRIFLLKHVPHGMYQVLNYV